MDASVYITLVMLISGIVGGLVNYFITDATEEKRLHWVQHMTIGATASFMVPLFLNMISANLIDQIIGNGTTPQNYSKLFVLAGFCLVAAVSSRAFIKTLSDKVLQEVREAKSKALEAANSAESAVEKASAASEDASIARQAVAPLIEEEGNEADQNSSQNLTLNNTLLSKDELLVLRTMGDSRLVLRSVTGIAKDAKVDKQLTNQAISNLVDKNLVGQTLGSSGQPRWFLTSDGRKLFLNSSQEKQGNDDL